MRFWITMHCVCAGRDLRAQEVSVPRRAAEVSLCLDYDALCLCRVCPGAPPCRRGELRFTYDVYGESIY